MPNNAVNSINQMLAQLNTMQASANEDANASTEDLYGDMIGRYNTGIRESGNSVKQALSRLNMASGSSASGRTATDMLRVDQGSNQQIGDFRLQAENMADNRRERSRGRETQLLGMIMGGNNTLLNQANADRQRRDMRRQANRQLWAGLAGGVLNFGANMLMPGPVEGTPAS